MKALLAGYRSEKPYLFPGRWRIGHICPESADAILRAAFKRLGIEGADLLGLLLQVRDELGRELSPEEICDELLMLVFAGYETTTSVLV